MSLGRGERAGEIAADARLRSPRDAAESVDCGPHPRAHRGGGDADLVQNRRDDSLFLAKKGVEEVDAVDLRALTPRGIHECSPQRLGRLHRQTVDFDHLMFLLSLVTQAVSAILADHESAILADFDAETPLHPPAQGLSGHPSSL